MKISGVDHYREFSLGPSQSVKDERKTQEGENTSSSDTDSLRNTSSSTNSLSGKQKSSTQPNRSDRVTLETSQEVIELKKRDAEVKSHEQAHIAAGSRYVRGGAKYEYSLGPNGKQYAIGGEVSIDTSPVPGDPQGTIEKMEVVRRAAVAPAQPSSQDRAVAAKAANEAGRARQELMKQALESMNASMVNSPVAKGQNVDKIV